MVVGNTVDNFDTITNKYKKNFRYLRVLRGIKGLSGQVIVEAVTPDGRVITDVVPTTNNGIHIKRLLEDWGPSGGNDGKVSGGHRHPPATEAQ